MIFVHGIVFELLFTWGLVAQCERSGRWRGNGSQRPTAGELAVDGVVQEPFQGSHCSSVARFSGAVALVEGASGVSWRILYGHDVQVGVELAISGAAQAVVNAVTEGHLDRDDAV